MYLPHKNESALRVSVLTGAGTKIVSPLLQDGFNVVGIAELNCAYTKQPCSMRFIKNCYRLFFKFKRTDCLFLKAKKRRIPYLDLKKTIDGRLRTWLEALKPDILVVYMAPLLPPEIFMVPTFGTINMHPSLLPRYRGAHPILWMHLNMDQEGGVTIHRVDTGMDTGEILAQAAFHIPLGADEESVEHTAIDKLGVPLLKKVLMQFETGSVNALPQPAVKVSDSCKRLSHEEYRARLDWDNWSVTHMWHVLRCTRHWMAIYLPDKLRYRSGVWSIGAIEYGCNSLPYGVLEKDANGYYLNHRDGKIRLEYKASFEGFIKVWLKRVGNCCLHKQLAFGRSLELVPLTTAVVESLF